MPDYEKMYFTLFNRVSDTIEALQEAQRLTEDMYAAGESLHLVETLGQISRAE